ncbi:response regulator transcription factor [Fulvivirga sp. RKSG066]|uniref:LytR/AlgR family response regulator transcription factor n=1 Tax=Fulvivirga aurantia TaxID=2529383 RepID=UPI0012BD4E94|nr:LytTR family DNA-binding domain-containing protein [Fulvivirga aurantia]MTI23307.1 response regulator transcription factor [Fulvivirga aurantia]
MQILIIEDERLAANRLEKLILSCESDAQVLAKIDSVEKSVEWLKKNPEPNLIFMDIQLADGLSFEIFEHTSITSPIIFTTAYDEYALKAFKVNSIDYLLKPIDKEELERALNKFHDLLPKNTQPYPLDQMATVMQMLSTTYKNRFLVKTGEHIKSIAVDEILFFFSRDKATYCHTVDNRNYLLDYSLEQIDGLVDPKVYFRVNRKYLVRIESIKDIISYSNSRLKLKFKNEHTEEPVVSRDRVSDFKAWLDR